MNWKIFRSRVMLVGIAFPLVGVIVLVLPQSYHLGVNLVVVAVSLLGGLEMAALFDARKIPTSSVLAPMLGASLPAGTYLVRVQIAGKNYRQNVTIQDGHIAYLVFRPT